MKQVLIALLSLSLAGVAFAATDDTASAPAKPKTKQQIRMGECSKESKGKKGDERKAFMKACLSGKSVDAAASAASATDGQVQQDKTKACNAQVKGKRGDERKALLQECLSK